MTALLWVVRGLRWFVSAALLASVLLSAVVVAIGLTGVLHIRGELTGSMAPRIHVGDLVIYRPEKAEDARPGQIISFNRAGTQLPVTHRIAQLSIADGTVNIVTKGDANDSVDAREAIFPAQQTVWHEVGVISGVGRLINRLTGRSGVGFILGFLPLFFALPWLERLIRQLPDAAELLDNYDYSSLAILARPRNAPAVTA
ncbi:signal peptidase I [Jatrophihabitans sp. GAS493]|uniref:signal peptidase I n=1 Tax=Jatrophihabitans sp. GAS493 TaxID=1907575 RepID=UPI000BB9132E|nr:signal peptidase I [Jatrophihabitans sp. GAS493]SOD71076.1 signal peptidase I [Jatrophihabitans sp. GAS493]